MLEREAEDVGCHGSVHLYAGEQVGTAQRRRSGVYRRPAKI